jgi:YD repeat-containing protein
VYILVARFPARSLLFFLTVLSFAACATAPKPLTGLVPGREMETLQSAVHVSIRQGETSRGGRGYLVFQRPDRFHLVILSPFGQSLFETYSDGGRFVALFPGEKTAYRGSVAELPEGVRLWGLMRWVVERPPVAGPTSGERDNVTADGRRERVSYDGRGLVVSRRDEAGNRVAYRDYEGVDGVAFPLGIEISDREGTAVSITFDEPELNRPLEEGALTPVLGQVRLLPFSAFPGLM